VLVVFRLLLEPQISLGRELDFWLLFDGNMLLVLDENDVVFVAELH